MFFKQKKHKPYKFIDFKFSATTEILAQNKRKYRTVFDEHELQNLETELSFYNKQVDEQNWTATIRIECWVVNPDGTFPGTTPACQAVFDVEVLSSEPICYVYRTWKSDLSKELWQQNNYLWNIYINQEKVAEKTCFVQAQEPVTNTHNPYFKVVDFKFFHLSTPQYQHKKDFRYDARLSLPYIKQFSNQDSPLNIGVDFCIYINNLPNIHVAGLKWYDYYFEFILNCYDPNGFLKQDMLVKERIHRLMTDGYLHVFIELAPIHVPESENGKYRVEILFMDRLVATSFFAIGEQEIEGGFDYVDVIHENRQNAQAFVAPHDDETQQEIKDTPETEPSLQDLLTELDSLVGLSSIKNRIHEYVQYIEFLKLRQELGFQEDKRFNLHSVFIGNPGTGKTTVAKLIGKIYYKLGLLSNGDLHEVGRAELIGQYIGQTAPKVKDIIDYARGGVLFIDEAYSLMRASDDDRDYGNEAIEVLVKEMSDGAGDIAIFAAGYPKEMNVFLDSNPGLRSRFGLFLEFADYLPQELISILDKAAEKKAVRFTENAKKLLHKHIVAEYRKRNKSFGNARFIESLVEQTKKSLGLRIMKEVAPELYSREVLSTITEEDVKKIIVASDKPSPDIPIDSQALQTALQQLDAMIGIENVKKEIHEIVKLVSFYKESKQDVLGRFSLHAVFKGNPGTGKTTVARLIADIYKALGILERGHLVECDRQSLVAGFVGQTAIKTQEMIDRAKGGVLFIDEAYALSPPDALHDFGTEAVETLLKAMEDHRHEFAVIVAGYPDEMTKFLSTNPGLQSRFDREIYFEDLTTDQLYTVATEILASYQLTPDAQAAVHLKQFIGVLSLRRDKFFGNARAMRKIAEKAVRNQHLRMADLPAEDRTQATLTTLTLADVAEFNATNQEYLTTKRIGF